MTPALLLLVPLLLGGCDKVRGLVGMGNKTEKAAKAAPDGGATLAKAPAAADGGAERDDEAAGEREHNKDRDGGAGHGSGDDDLETSYTPRHRALDAEDCDEVTKEVLERLKEQSERLKQRAAEVKQREREVLVQKEALGKLRKEVDAQTAELSRLLARLDAAPAPAPTQQASAADAERRRGEQVKITSALVAGMPPAKAAAVLAALKDTGLASQVLQTLPSEQSGRVLAAMRPEVAARLMEREREAQQP